LPLKCLHGQEVTILTGKFAVNKAKLRIEVYYEKEETSYID